MIDLLVDVWDSALEFIVGAIPYVVAIVALYIVYVIIMQVRYKKAVERYSESVELLELPPVMKTVLKQAPLYVSKRDTRKLASVSLERIAMSRLLGLTFLQVGMSERLVFGQVDISLDKSNSKDRKMIVEFKPDSSSNISTETIKDNLSRITLYWGADNYKILSNSEVSIKVQFIYGEDEFLTDTTLWDSSMREYQNVPDKVLMGLDEMGEVVDHQIADTHTLIAGKSGSGKGSIIWNIIAPLAGRRDVLIYGVDLKGGMEFKQNEHVFAEEIATTEETLCELIDRLHEHMEERMSMMSALKQRKFIATDDKPLILLVIDEALDLDTMAQMKEFKDSMENFRKILMKGRATGISVIAALQNPNVSAFRYSKSFPSKIALRMSEGQQLGFIGGESFEVGKLDKYHQSIKGLCIMTTETGDIKLVKAFYPSDEVIQALPHNPACKCESCKSTVNRVL